MEEERVRIEDYAHSPAHYAVALGDMTRLTRLLSALPHLAHPLQVLTESESVSQERIADKIAAVVDRCDVSRRDTPLHLAVRLDHPAAASALAAAGADPSLQNASGWTPLQEALCLRRRRLALLLLRHHRLSAWSKFRRRLPPLLAALRHIPDFYLELAFHFESSLLPFLSRAAPSDTYRIWKRGADLRADTSIAGFDGLCVRRADQSFLFLGSGGGGGGGIAAAHSRLPPGSLLVLDRARKEIHDAFEGADSSTPGPDESEMVADASAYRPGLDITAASADTCMPPRERSLAEERPIGFRLHDPENRRRRRRHFSDVGQLIGRRRSGTQDYREKKKKKSKSGKRWKATTRHIRLFRRRL